MKEIFLSKSINYITKYNKDYNTDEIERIQYGLEGLYLTITKLIIVLIISFILGILRETILTLLFFNIIRFPAFGVHAEKSSTCLLTSICIIIGLTFIISKATITVNIKTIMCILLIFNYCLFAPADTIKRPLTNKRKRIIRKISSVLIAIIYTTLILTVKTDLSNIILNALIIEGLMINPIMYKLLNTPYNNYKKIV